MNHPIIRIILQRLVLMSTESDPRRISLDNARSWLEWLSPENPLLDPVFKQTPCAQATHLPDILSVVSSSVPFPMQTVKKTCCVASEDGPACLSKLACSVKWPPSSRPDPDWPQTTSLQCPCSSSVRPRSLAAADLRPFWQFPGPAEPHWVPTCL